MPRKNSLSFRAVQFDSESAKSENESESSELKTSKLSDESADDLGLESETFSITTTATTRSFDSVLESLTNLRLNAGKEAVYGDVDSSSSCSDELPASSPQKLASITDSHDEHQDESEDSKFKNRYVSIFLRSFHLLDQF
ncbi:unnamed protein product [Anisakis simplex]|uniref:Suppressor protein SRP40-like n=1 Tax=Anisakis simplex TaxID=6269 RepID=A0A0M3JD11_ANISI|nr:unnamed protein product [Anisakis simplex]